MFGHTNTRAHKSRNSLTCHKEAGWTSSFSTADHRRTRTAKSGDGIVAIKRLHYRRDDRRQGSSIVISQTDPRGPPKNGRYDPEQWPKKQISTRTEGVGENGLDEDIPFGLKHWNTWRVGEEEGWTLRTCDESRARLGKSCYSYCRQEKHRMAWIKVDILRSEIVHQSFSTAPNTLGHTSTRLSLKPQST